jgi:two-component system, NarL family, sensor kinase
MGIFFLNGLAKIESYFLFCVCFYNDLSAYLYGQVMTQYISDSSLIIMLGIAGLFMLGAGIFLAANLRNHRRMTGQLKDQAQEGDHLKQMIQAAFELQENERKRIAKELHDDVGMMLMTLRAQLNAAIDQSHEMIRKISWELLPPTLERFGLAQTLQEMCQRNTNAATIQISFLEKGTAQTLDKNQETLLYRITQECVNNALKHARAINIRVVMDWTDTALWLSVTDDGVGFNFPEEKDKIKSRMGVGLTTIASRVQLLGGTWQYKKNSPSGTVVQVSVPINFHG